MNKIIQFLLVSIFLNSCSNISNKNNFQDSSINYNELNQFVKDSLPQFVLIDNIKRHPSQIYEAFFEGIILFFILNYLFRRKYIATPGKLSALFLIFYSLFRYSLEFFRVPDPQIGFLFLNSTLGQIISLLFFVIGVLLFYLKKNEN